MNAKTGGAAFPALNFIIPNDLEERHVRRLGETQGMTLRDYAVIAMMQAWRQSEAGTPLEDRMSSRLLATLAAEDADAMLKEREGVSDEG